MIGAGSILETTLLHLDHFGALLEISYSTTWCFMELPCFNQMPFGEYQTNLWYKVAMQTEVYRLLCDGWRHDQVHRWPSRTV